MTFRVLSIQSHVVHGYVGNRSSVFPLQLLGVEVDFVNSVQFSNHTGYAFIKGQVVSAAELRELYAGLRANGLHHCYTHVLTGYVGCASFLEAVAEIIRDLKKENPRLKYYCDPVLGDSGELYVSPDLVPVYKEKILPLADVVLPNQFEAEILTDCKITDEASALACIQLLHSRFNIPVVVLSSTDIRCHPSQSIEDYVLGYASRRCADSVSLLNDPHLMRPSQGEAVCNGWAEYEQLRLTIPLLDCEFRGTGDLFSALTLARLESALNSHSDCAFSRTFELVLSSMQAVLRRTLDEIKKVKGSAQATAISWDLVELKLVQSIDDIRNPTINGSYVEKLDRM